MHRPALRAAALAAALLVTLAAPAAGSVTTARSAPAPGLSNPSPTPALLINGDRVITSDAPGAPHTTAVAAPGSGLASDLLTMRLGGREFVIPAAALPYLGHGLAENLFDVSALRLAERDGRLPVTIGFTGRLPRLPGITLTHRGAGSAQGYLTTASSARFGAALARQMLADHARGSYGQDGLFAGGVSIGLAGAPAPARARTDFPMHVLTVTGTNLAGKPDNGDSVSVLDVDSLARFGDPNESDNVFFHGTAKFSVPSGTYYAVATFVSSAGFRIDVLPQFTVSGDTTEHVSEQAASSKVSIRTPRPAVAQAVSFELGRQGRLATSAFTWTTIGGGSIWVNPTTQAPTDGKLGTATTAQLTGPGQARVPYSYSLNFPGPAGLIPPQHFAVKPGDLATVSDTYLQDVPSAGGWLSFGGTAQELSLVGGGGLIIHMRLPGVQTRYLSATPGMLWQNQYWELYNSLAGGQADVLHHVQAGVVAPDRWDAYPLHPAPNTVAPGTDVFPALPTAVRAGNRLILDVTPFSDSTSGHTGSGFSSGFGRSGKVSGSYAVYQNGSKIAGGNAVKAAQGGSALFVQAPLSRKPSTVRFALSAARTGKQFRLSTASTDVWTWRSRPEPGATVPAPWFCGVTGATLDRHCAVQQMLMLNYQVRGMGSNGEAPAGRQVVGFSVSPLPLAAPENKYRISARVSFDNGTTWHPATLSRGAPQFQASFKAPAGRKVTLQFQVRGTDSSTLTETIRSAYATSATSAAPAHTTAAHTTAAQGAGMRRACPAPRPGYEACYALYRPQTAVNRAIAAGVRGASPSGWSPAQLASAYKLPVNRNSHQTVAVSIAMDTPNLGSYLNEYRKFYGLPPCTAASGCFRKVNQNGQASPLPRSGVGSGWDLEATLDVSMISAACPHCHILVVEGNSPSFHSLAVTDQTAAKLGAQVISNSYGARENGFALAQAKAYEQPGHTVVASAGDSGYTAASFPADLGSVVAVGGTELSRAHNARGWNERVWKQQSIFGAGGSGCSAYVAKPSWQHDPHCPGRTVADVSAVAANIPIFNQHYGGWVTVAGTSISAPLIAGIYGLAGNGATLAPGSLYAHQGGLFDITSGNNALFGTPQATCGSDYLCVAKPGYDAPTGLGTPDGIGGF